MPIAQVLSKHTSLEDILEVLAHVGIQVCLKSLVPLETVHDNRLYLICSVLIRKILVRDLDSLLEYNDQRINQFHRTLECLGAKVNPPEIQQGVSEADRMLFKVVDEDVRDPQHNAFVATPTY